MEGMNSCPVQADDFMLISWKLLKCVKFGFDEKI